MAAASWQPCSRSCGGGRLRRRTVRWGRQPAAADGPRRRQRPRQGRGGAASGASSPQRRCGGGRVAQSSDGGREAQPAASTGTRSSPQRRRRGWVVARSVEAKEQAAADLFCLAPLPSLCERIILFYWPGPWRPAAEADKCENHTWRTMLDVCTATHESATSSRLLVPPVPSPVAASAAPSLPRSRPGAAARRPPDPRRRCVLLPPASSSLGAASPLSR